MAEKLLGALKAKKRCEIPQATQDNLRALQKECDRFHGHFAKASAGNAEEEIQRLVIAYRQDPSNANFDALLNSPSNEERVRRRHLAQGAAYEAFQRLKGTKVGPALMQALPVIIAGMEKEAAEIETQERTTAESVGVPWEPSETLLAVHNRVQHYRGILTSIERGPETCGEPRHLLKDFMSF